MAYATGCATPSGTTGPNDQDGPDPRSKLPAPCGPGQRPRSGSCTSSSFARIGGSWGWVWPPPRWSSLACRWALPQAGNGQLHLRGRVTLNLLNLSRDGLRRWSVVGEAAGPFAKKALGLAQRRHVVRAGLRKPRQEFERDLQRGGTIDGRLERITGDLGVRCHDGESRRRTGGELPLRPLPGAERAFVRGTVRAIRAARNEQRQGDRGRQCGPPHPGDSQRRGASRLISRAHKLLAVPPLTARAIASIPASATAFFSAAKCVAPGPAATYPGAPAGGNRAVAPKWSFIAKIPRSRAVNLLHQANGNRNCQSSPKPGPLGRA